MRIYNLDELINIDNSTIILDIDGTIVFPGKDEISSRVDLIIQKLKIKNQIILCSNRKKYERDQKLSDQLGVPFIRSVYRKPSKKIIRGVDMKESKVVIGDKILTDGIFANSIGAKFYKIKRLKSKNDPIIDRMIDFIDDIASYLFGNLLIKS